MGPIWPAQRSRWAAGAWLAAALCCFSAATPAVAQPPDPRSAVAFGPCIAGYPDAEAICGVFTAPESRGTASKRLVQMPFVILPAKGAEKAEPVVYLSGGPGSSAILASLRFRERPDLRQGRDFIFLEQRGNPFSTPSFACDAVALKRFVDVSKVRACSDALIKEGVDLSSYGSDDAATDLHELRQLLGLPSWNVLGISYGTRLALTYARKHPEGIRALVLDSVSSPEINREFFAGQPAYLLNRLDAFVAACENDAACKASHPQLRANLDKAILELSERPIRLNDGRRMNGRLLLSIVADMLSDRKTLGAIPGVLEAAARRDPSQVVKLSIAHDGDPPRGLELRPGSTYGRIFSVFCRESYPFTESITGPLPTDRPWPKEAQVAARVLSDWVWEACAAWPVKPERAEAGAPVKSEIPALLLAGEYDPLTAPSGAFRTARHLPNSQVYVIPAGGHVQLEEPCARQIAAAFLRKPEAKVDASCLATMNRFWPTNEPNGAPR